MKVDKIRHYKSLFVDHVREHGLWGHMYMYESQARWQSEWDIEALDLPSVFGKALTSTISGRLWGGSRNSAKESMLAMISSNKEFMRSAFRDLFSVEKDLGLRCDRFLFYCNQAINNVSDAKMIDHRHKRATMMLYLAFNFPDKYTLYKYGSFHKMMEKLESRNIPMDIELERYQKSMRAIYSVLSKDDEGWESMLATALGDHYLPGSLMVMNDFAMFVASQEE